jgi:nucleoid-associated protein YgaU
MIGNNNNNPSDNTENDSGSLFGQMAANAASSDSSDFQEYEVRSGDTLSEIGARHDVSWREIYEANRDVINDPDMIEVGWKLKIPQKKSE